MLEASRIIGVFSAVFLVAAIATWSGLLGRLLLPRLDGTATVDLPQAETAALLLVVAFGSSAVAALLAIGGWFAS